MEVAIGMQISLPTEDGSSQTIHGPYQVRMPLPHGAPPPIQAPPNYQTVVRIDVDPQTQLPIRVFSVVPVQSMYPTPSPVYPHTPSPSTPGYPGDIQTVSQVIPSDIPIYPPGGGETDEEKNKIKLLLGFVDAPEVANIGINWVELRWKALAKADNFKEPVSYLCEIQCMNKQENSNSGMQWEIKYQGRDLNCRIDSLLPGAEYLSRLKARHQNITGNESPAVIFKTQTGKPDRPGQPVVVNGSTAKEPRLALKWSPSADNGDPVKEYILEMGTGVHRSNSHSNTWKEIYTGKVASYTIGERKTERLRPGSTYRFRVKAINSLGVSLYSEELVHKTQQPTLPVPENMRITEKTSTTMKIEWNREQQQRHLVYRLEISDDQNVPLDQSQFKFKNIYEGKDNFFKAINLRRATKYRFRYSTYYI